MRGGVACLLAVTLAVALALPASAARRAAKPAQTPTQPTQSDPRSPGLLSLLPADSVTEHTIEVGGQQLAYTATAGTLSLYHQNGERFAAIYYTAYVLKDAPAQNRPITFVFNGGPGASSAFLHLGLVGPRILDFGPTGRDGARAQLRDNPETWLAFTDLVMIDPIGTGWSRTAKLEDMSQFFGVRQDAESISKAIAVYVAQNGRTKSPKYLFGESYGGFRAAKVARELQDDQGIVVSGIVMLAPFLEGEFQFAGSRFPLSAALQLPSLAASELERRNAFTPQALAEAERFAMTEYLSTLAGPPPEGVAARAFYAKIAQITGLPVDAVEKSRGYVGDAYIKSLRGKNREVVSVYDATFAAPDPFPDSATRRGDDPILDGFTRAYGGAFAAYAREELGFKTEITYTLLAHDINGKWDWQSGSRRLGRPSASDDLRELLALHPNFRVLIAHGYNDVAVPYAASRYVVEHLPPIGAPGRVSLKLYRGGHMLYLKPETRTSFTADAKAFFQAPAP